MQTDELTDRLRRIYAAIDAAEERDLTKLPGEVLVTRQITAIFQDFSGGLSVAELENIVHSYIHNIANLQAPLTRWAKKNGHDKSKIDVEVEKSQPLKIIKALSNRDKHGPLRDGDPLGLPHRLRDIRREMRLTTKAEKGSSVVMRFGPGGIPQVSGSGSAVAITTADIIDANGQRIADLYTKALEAVRDWEQVLGVFGVSL